MTETFKYRAFISYSHADGRGQTGCTGRWRPIASPTPGRHEGRRGLVPSKLSPIFRDRDELSAAHRSRRQAHAALEQSAFLIVICSPAAARSRWVNEEVLAYKRLGREDRVFCLIVGGEPAASPARDRRECFPRADLQARSRRRAVVELERADRGRCGRQGEGSRHAKLKLIAGMLGVGLDELKQRELEVARKRLRVAYGIAAAMLVLAVAAGGAGWLAYVNGRKAERQLDEALSQRARFLVTKAEDARLGGAADQALLYLVEATKAADKRSRALLPWFARLTLARASAP